MKVAFDCKGTLLTGDDNILILYKAFESLGHEMFIWSSEYSFTVEAKDKFSLKGETCSKRATWDCEDSPELYMDIAIDDQNQTYLATHKLILVHNIPYFGSIDEAKAFVKALTKPKLEKVDFGLDAGKNIKKGLFE